MMYTESNLNSKTKGQIVTIALQLSERLEAISQGPLSADQVKAEFLSLKKDAQQIKDNAKKREQAHKEAIAKIEADTQRQIAELNLKYNAGTGKDAEEVKSLYDELENKVVQAKNDLTFGLEEEETKANIKLAAIKEKLETAEKEAETKMEDLTASVTKAKDKAAEEIERTNVEHSRKVEQQSYDNKIAFRDLNMDTLNKLAKETGVVIVDGDAHKTLTEDKDALTEKHSKELKAEVGKVKAMTESAATAKYTKLESEKNNEIALLQNDKNHLVAAKEALEVRVKDLEDRLKDVPNQIKEAVAAAKADISVSQDAAKK